MYRYALLVNPFAGSKPLDEKEHFARVLQRALGGDRSCALLGLHLPSFDKFPDLALEADGLGETVVVVGGDGTWSETINAIRRKRRYALVPDGSGNGLASVLGMSRNPLEAAKQILDGTPHPTDLVRCDGKWYATMAGIEPFTPRYEDFVAQEVGKTLALYLAAFRSAPAVASSPLVQVSIDGVVRAEDEPLIAGIVGTSGRWGRDIRIFRDELPHDGRFRTRMVHGRLRKALRGAAHVLYTRDLYTVGDERPGHQVIITSPDGDLPLQTDGIPRLSARTHTFEAIPDRIWLIYPARNQ